MISKGGRELRSSLLVLLKKQGFRLNGDHTVRQLSYQKDQVRAIHSYSRVGRLTEEGSFIRLWFPRLSHYFASGSEIDPAVIQPDPVLIDGSEELSALFRMACLWWSVPVSRGFGRRIRALVFDRSNGKLFGLLGLTDPVFNLNTRDSWIGWNARDREKRLCHVMDAYVLGAIPPYNRLLGAKFMGLLAASDFVRKVFEQRYGNVRSVILKRKLDGRLAMVTATSALGTSSIYNRLRYQGVTVFSLLGFTEGYGHFHLANGTFEKMREYLRSLGDQEITKYQFGSGPNYRIRVIRRALNYLGLPGDIVRHGVKRGVYVAPLAANAVGFLRGEAKRLQWHHRPIEPIVKYWRERWMLPRAVRDSSFREFRQEEWRNILGLA